MRGERPLEKKAEKDWMKEVEGGNGGSRR